MAVSPADLDVEIYHVVSYVLCCQNNSKLHFLYLKLSGYESGLSPLTYRQRCRSCKILGHTPMKRETPSAPSPKRVLLLPGHACGINHLLGSTSSHLQARTWLTPRTGQ